ncbi:hypothetical protein WG908_09965 [Sphingobium sp. AN641]|uniref:hypothetical protein n=1 Tax=Sphingobium sp. AN641 TaxID=3133443 RepID=UPI0030C2707C
MTRNYSRQTALVLLLLAGGCDATPDERRADTVAPGDAETDVVSGPSQAEAISANMTVPTAVPAKRSPDSRHASMLPDPPGILAPEPSLPLSALSVSSTIQSGDLPPSDDAAPVGVFPDEVLAFMVDRDGCDHFRGEEPFDNERRVYLEQNIQQLCTGTDARLATLRRRYSLQADVMAALSSYEDRVEAPARPLDKLP